MIPLHSYFQESSLHEHQFVQGDMFKDVHCSAVYNSNNISIIVLSHFRILYSCLIKQQQLLLKNWKWIKEKKWICKI